MGLLTCDTGEVGLDTRDTGEKEVGLATCDTGEREAAVVVVVELPQEPEDWVRWIWRKRGF